MKKLLWIAGFTGLMLGLLGIQTASKQEILNKETKTQTIIDSLQNVIDSLYHEIDTLQWENQIWDFNLSNNTTHLLSAIMFVESSYNDSAYHKGEDAVGCLQIRKCMVDDINRILKYQKSPLRFTYNSRWGFLVF
jgi:uncharacterized FlaG/YvyC family protein